MKRIIVLSLVIILLSGCTAPQKQEIEAESSSMLIIKNGTKEPIVPFESEQIELLPLPEQKRFSNSMEFTESLIANYEVLHYQEFNADFELRDMQMKKSDDGYIFIGQNVKSYDTSAINFSKPLNEYFNTPDNSYAVLVRFKSDEIDRLSFKFNNRFGRIMLDFYDSKYPAIDVHGDFYGDPMYSDDWNNYVYKTNEWAYSFMTITNYGQKSCYIWAEDDASDYNYHIFYGKDEFDSGSIGFSMELNAKGETVTVSDIWLYSYEEAKR